MLTKNKSIQGDDSATTLVPEILGWLAGEEDRLLAFLQATGLGPSDLRRAAGEPGFSAAVLYFVMGDEAGLVACARTIGVKPEAIAAEWRRHAPPDPDSFA